MKWSEKSQYKTEIFLHRRYYTYINLLLANYSRGSVCMNMVIAKSKKMSNQNEENFDLSDFVCSMVVCTIPDRLIWVFQKLLISCDFHSQQPLEFTQNAAKQTKKTSSE